MNRELIIWIINIVLIVFIILILYRKIKRELKLLAEFLRETIKGED